jgi:uncharacterized protein (DUF983 family)
VQTPPRRKNINRDDPAPLAPKADPRVLNQPKLTGEAMTAALISEKQERNIWLSLKRGFGLKCPNCGKGAMYGRYLKVNASCAACGEELHHQRADDAPPYLTIFVVGHIIGASMLMVEEYDDTLPIWIHSLVWPILTILLSLYFLPRLKGALIAYQWALRMHGFDHQHSDETGPASVPSKA